MSERNETPMRTFAGTALSVVLLVALAAPFVGMLLRVDTGGFAGENRSVTKWPHLKLTRAGLKEWPGNYEAWFNDHFGFRNTLVLMNSRLRFSVLGVSTSDQVVIGKDGWLFYAAENIIDDYRGLYPFTEKELRGWQGLFEQRRDWLASQGIRYVIAIAPEKSSVYPEYLPGWVRPGKTMKLDQLLAWMKAHSTVKVLDLREGPRRAKPDYRVFQVTDTHWSDDGAFAAYRQIADQLKTLFPALKPLERSDFDCKKTPLPGGDLAGMLAVKNVITEERTLFSRITPGAAHPVGLTELMKKKEWHPDRGPTVFEREDAELGKAVMIHDSFSVQMRPFLSGHFKRIVYIWWDFPPDVIMDEKPDVLIEERVQRTLNHPVYADVPPVAGFKLKGADGPK